MATVEAEVGAGAEVETQTESQVDSTADAGMDPELAAFYDDAPSDVPTRRERAAKSEAAPKGRRNKAEAKAKQPPAERAAKPARQAKPKQEPPPEVEDTYEEAPDAHAADEEDSEFDEESADTVEFDDDAIRMAEIHGYGREEVESLFPSRDALMHHLAAMDRRAIAKAKAEREQQDGTRGRTEADDESSEQSPGTKAEKRDAAQAANTARKALEKLKLEFNPDLMDEESAKTFSALNDHYHQIVEDLSGRLESYSALEQKAKQLEQYVGVLMDNHQRQYYQTVSDQADQFFSELGEEYQTLYGVGKGDDLAEGSAALKNRRELIAMAFGELGGNLPPKLQMKRALSILNFDKQEQLARTKLAGQVEQRRKMGVNRPTQRRSSAISPKGRAMNFIRGKLRNGSAPQAASADRELDNWFGE